MTHENFLPGPVDPSRVELVEDHELRYWTQHFRCSAEQLLEAIESVGIDARAIGEYLALRREAGAAILQHLASAGAQGPRRGKRDWHVP